MSCGLHSLPEEVVVHIFSFLDQNSKLRMSSTCKYYLRVMSNYPELMEDVCVSFSSATPESTYELFSKMSRNFCYFQFCGIYFCKKFIHFLKKFGPRFRILSFRNFLQIESLEEHQETIHNCTNLWQLLCGRSSAWMLFSHLPKLKVLVMDVLCPIFRRGWLQLQKMGPDTLTEFVSAEFYGREVWESKPLFKDFIWNRRLTLQKLDITNLDIPGESMLQISKLEGLRLKHLDVTHCRQLSDVISSVCNNQRSIVNLYLGGIFNIKDTAVESICTSLPQLKELILSDCKFVKKSVATIFQLKHLHRLVLNDCSCIMPEDFQRALVGFACHNLQNLGLSATRVDDKFLSQFLPLIPDLQLLDLSECTITDLTVSVISKRLTSLRYLDLGSCEMISDDGLLGLVEGSKSRPVPLSNIKGLGNLNLTGCKRLTEVGLMKAIQFDRLMFLNLNYCVKLTKAGIRELKNRNCKLVSLRNKTLPT